MLSLAVTQIAKVKGSGPSGLGTGSRHNALTEGNLDHHTKVQAWKDDMVEDLVMEETYESPLELDKSMCPEAFGSRSVPTRPPITRPSKKGIKRPAEDGPLAFLQHSTSLALGPKRGRRLQ